MLYLVYLLLVINCVSLTQRTRLVCCYHVCSKQIGLFTVQPYCQTHLPIQVAEGEVEVVGTMEDEEKHEDEDSVVVHLRVPHMGTTVLVVEVLRHIDTQARPVEALRGSQTGRATFITRRAGAGRATSVHFDTIVHLTRLLVWLHATPDQSQRFNYDTVLREY